MNSPDAYRRRPSTVPGTRGTEPVSSTNARGTPSVHTSPTPPLPVPQGISYEPRRASPSRITRLGQDICAKVSAGTGGLRRRVGLGTRKRYDAVRLADQISAVRKVRHSLSASRAEWALGGAGQHLSSGVDVAPAGASDSRFHRTRDTGNRWSPSAPLVSRPHRATCTPGTSRELAMATANQSEGVRSLLPQGKKA